MLRTLLRVTWQRPRRYSWVEDGAAGRAPACRSSRHGAFVLEIVDPKSRASVSLPLDLALALALALPVSPTDTSVQSGVRGDLGQRRLAKGPSNSGNKDVNLWMESRSRMKARISRLPSQCTHTNTGCGHDAGRTQTVGCVLIFAVGGTFGRAGTWLAQDRASRES